MSTQLLFKASKFLKRIMPVLVLMSMLVIVFASVNVAFAEDPFKEASETVESLAKSAITALRKILLPLGSVAILASVIGMYLPGQSAKNVDRLKAVIYAVLGAMILVGAVEGIMSLAQSIGEQIGNGL